MRYFLKLAYLGTHFHGWQIQPNGYTVQEHLNKHLSLLLRKDINVIAAGRTDTGVHAKEMFAHFDWDEGIEDTSTLVQNLNKLLAPDVVINAMFVVKPNIHARFDAIQRSYEYRINRQRSPFNHNLAANIFYPLNLEAMQAASNLLIGKRDFSSFSKSRTQTKTNICDIRQAYWEDRGAEWVFHISADRFLRNMVRAIVGSLLEVGKGRMCLEDFQKMIEAQDRKKAGQSVPAQGLYLIRVVYPQDIFI
ncbi:MAG: tRNA pseudouridine(38-40) synthase TruA [Bacteroidetes bacterium]|nr:MAG: tRNA pseudouridine(38-40) synthase TruA [Bacteroidota bacterium]